MSYSERMPGDSPEQAPTDKEDMQKEAAAIERGQDALNSICEELGTPLATITGYVELLSLGYQVTPEDIKTLVNAKQTCEEILIRYRQAGESGNIHPSPHAFQPGTTVLSIHPRSQANVDIDGNPLKSNLG